MRLAILGAGKIARKMAQTIAGLKDRGIEAYAVASRDGKKAQEFAREWGFTTSYGSYEELLADSRMDLVYVATPHSHHREHAIMCLDRKKAVLCEKAFSLNAGEARDMVEASQRNSTLLAEAIWTRYMPMRRKIDELIASGIVGKGTSLTANLGYPLEHVERMREPALAGGALLDLGVYTINFALMCFGHDIAALQTSCTRLETGVDAIGNISLAYTDGRFADLHFTMKSATDRRGMLFGDKGYIEVQNINNPEVVRVFNPQHECIATYEAPPQVTGYEYEVLACQKALEAGALECPDMPHSETIRVMELMDQVRAVWGIRYPQEDT